MLYRTLKRMIQNGQIDGIQEKLDLFYAMGRITKDEYQELSEMIPKET